MNDFLFDVPETLSPRLAWMRDNGIKSEFVTGRPVGNYWHAWVDGNADNYAQGFTQDEALDALAKRLKIKPWRS